ncbi:GNAT family N-acetyltransferase [Candidatus Magnetominusculus xianensis]|uniref:GCN5 family acetyltransferase n=1 Tax=Candidatus Magnetominusculus xianensis TaxID=1748249 RepID=A0ABR5SJP7_9BACT|nr:GNAT family N-acetyltransferase [Candidatus Magnetominusculus xianensis]KWT94956.1 GCN5 family acetyltransferase [Candidatus Magnetominusculus xianensis]MBF0405202.1 GNAT family N-acetyltransferase [Nitrospirota bacterium]
MPQSDLIIRTMTKDEFGIATSWSSAEGWNPGNYDAAPFYGADSNGFFLGLIDNEPVGCISAVRYGREFGFIGFYIVHPEFRGNGYGLRLWHHAMDYLGERNVGLDGVLAQQENYRKSGFTLAYRNIRFEGLGTGGIKMPSNVVSLSTIPLEAVSDYDVFPAPRPHFLNLWITEPAHICLAALDGGRLTGFGAIRPSQRGFRVGPLFANNLEIAENLFIALISHVPGQFVYLDAPEINPHAVRLAEKHGMTQVFETARMYTKTQPKIEIEKIFGVTSLELG